MINSKFINEIISNDFFNQRKKNYGILILYIYKFVIILLDIDCFIYVNHEIKYSIAFFFKLTA